MSLRTNWHGTGLTDRGLVRSSNQDAFAVEDRLRLWVVADGMGGHAGGDVASRLAVDAVLTHVRARASAGGAAEGAGPASDERLLREAIDAAQRAILHEARARKELTGMGTTCVALRISSAPDPLATIAHVGDSRAYRLRGNRLEQLTRDHSLLDDYIRRGLVTPAQAFTHPLRHVLSRALGTGTCEPDVGVHDLEDSDLILLCTDGLTKMIKDDRIADVLLRERTAPDRACGALVQEALGHGGADNVTVIICTAGPDGPEPRR